MTHRFPSYEERNAARLAADRRSDRLFLIAFAVFSIVAPLAKMAFCS